MKTATRLFLLLGLLTLSGVMVWGQARQANNAVPQTAPAPAEAPKLTGDAPNTQIGQPVNPKTYVIGVEDVLRVEVWREDTISRTVPVRTDGMITLPLINDLQAEGLTPERLGQHIAEGLSGNGFVKPLVTVSVLDVKSKKYTMAGKIARSGAVALITPIRIFDAINQAGGFQDFANQKDIIILRGTQTFHFNYKDFVKGKGHDKNIFLENGDTVIVK